MRGDGGFYKSSSIVNQIIKIWIYLDNKLTVFAIGLDVGYKQKVMIWDSSNNFCLSNGRNGVATY